MHIYACLPSSKIYLERSVFTSIILYIPNKNAFLAGMTRIALTFYFHCASFKIKIKFLNFKRGKTVVLKKTWEYNTSYMPIRIIVP